VWVSACRSASRAAESAGVCGYGSVWFGVTFALQHLKVVGLDDSLGALLPLWCLPGLDLKAAGHRYQVAFLDVLMQALSLLAPQGAVDPVGDVTPVGILLCPADCQGDVSNSFARCLSGFGVLAQAANEYDCVGG
jgi:hypothetical protein